MSLIYRACIILYSFMNDNIDGDKGVTWGEGVLGVP